MTDLAAIALSNVCATHLLGAAILCWFFELYVHNNHRVDSRNTDLLLSGRPPPRHHHSLDMRVKKSRKARGSTATSRPRVGVRGGGGGIDEKEEPSRLQLEKQNVPESTEQERRRFLKANKGDAALASSALASYLAWRTLHDNILQEKVSDEIVSAAKNNDTDSADERDWNVACAVAIKACSEETDTNAAAASEYLPLPRVVRTCCMLDGKECVDRNGFRMLQLLPGRMDERLAPLTTYALAIALYMDRKLARDSDEKITVLIDVRTGRGWRNMSAAHMIPFMKGIFALLQSMFPERLARAIVYPVPFAVSWIWNVVKFYLDADTAGKICLLIGSAGVMSPMPSGMAAYIDETTVAVLESERLATFDPAASC